MGSAGGERGQFADERLLVVDDEKGIGEYFVRALRDEFLAVQAVTSLEEATRALLDGLATGAPFHVVLVDLNLGRDRGELILDLAETLSVQPRVVTFSGHQQDALRVLKVQGRAVYLPKPVSAEVLLLAARARPAPVVLFGELYALSSREIESLALVTSGATDQAMAERLHVSKHTARTYLKRAARKVGVRGTRALIGELTRFASLVDFSSRVGPVAGSASG